MLQSLLLKLYSAISHAFVLSNGEGAVCQIHIGKRQAAQLTHTNAGLEKHLQDGVVTRTAAC